jgi:hypothetical protein
LCERALSGEHLAYARPGRRGIGKLTLRLLCHLQLLLEIFACARQQTIHAWVIQTRRDLQHVLDLLLLTRDHRIGRRSAFRTQCCQFCGSAAREFKQ